MAQGFTKVLIANRGEIAVRIARTVHAMGLKTVAIYSEADVASPHLEACDEAVLIGPAPALESYLRIDRVVAAARETGADAVHPGYGFLAEDADFAAACELAGLTFVGPPAAAMRLMGNKRAAKACARDAGVAVIPGYEGADQSDERLTAEAGRIGPPLMVKAAAGGGGRGLRLVDDLADLGAALAAARSEARASFGDDELILEGYVRAARHVEVQVFADGHGNTIHLGERDCSVQRRHQKVIEEAPSPALDDATRARMAADACRVARAAGYVGAGTVEFLLDGDGEYHFLEMNTRLQVEHPVTELTTGLDLVEWQIRVARGEPLPLKQDAVRLNGHAIEARLYAEDPALGFLPQSGEVRLWAAAEGEGTRIDHAMAEGFEVSPYYDPLVAKVVAWGEDREAARERLIEALRETVLLGPRTNKEFLLAALGHEEFVAGRAATDFIDRHFGASPERQQPAPRVVALAAAAISTHIAHKGGWRLTGEAPSWPLELACDDVSFKVDVELDGDTYRVAVDDQGAVTVAFDNAAHVFRRGTLWLDHDGGVYEFRVVEPAARARDGDAGAPVLNAPMAGRIVAVAAAPGDRVASGAVVVILEAMKMQHEVRAGFAAVIDEIRVGAGEQVGAGQTLAVLSRAEPAEAEE